MGGTNNIVIPGAEDAPSLYDLLGPPPNVPVTDQPPVFRSAVEELDIYRVAFLIAGIVIGRLLK